MDNDNCFSLAEEKFCKMTDFLKDKRSCNIKLSDLENYTNKNGRELLRHLLTGHLNKRGMGDIGQTVVGSDGVNRTHKRIRTRTIKCLFGKIEIKRIGYSHRNISSLFPLDIIGNKEMPVR